MMNRNLEMVAALAVPVNGFETPQLALSAAVDGGVVESLILPGFCDCDEEALTAAATYSRAQMRRKRVLMGKWK